MADRILTCVYCGQEYPQDTPAWGDEVLTDHIAQCEKHPMRAVVEERDRLLAALEGLVGEKDPEVLRAMLPMVMAAGPGEGAAMRDAIQALLASYGEENGG